MASYSEYPALVSLGRDGRYRITFRDLGGAGAEGLTLEEAMRGVRTSIIGAMKGYLARGSLVPAPSPRLPGEELVRLPVSLEAKVIRAHHMLEEGVSPSELAREMGVRPQEVTRLLDLRHATKIDILERAMESLGMKYVLRAAPLGEGGTR